MRRLTDLLVACAVIALLETCRSAEPARPDAGASRTAAVGAAALSVRDPSVLVLVHSFTGHTAAAGREVAEMLGGAFVRVWDPPQVADVTPVPGPQLKDVLAGIRMDGVRRLFLGFPIYDEAPSAVAQQIVRSVPLEGVRVTPFFTYVHYFQQGTLDALAGEISARGGEATAPIALRLPALVSDEDILGRTRRALLERRELWAAPEPPAEVRCADVPAPHLARLCSVPPGLVWTGEVSPEASDSSNPPRLFRVSAFDLDEKEISIAQYRRCVAAQRCRERKSHGVLAGLEGVDDDLPMPDLSWSDAVAYCSFVGLRLPTEPEWVRAARGSSLDPYPWGDALPGTGPPRANLGEKPANGLPHYALAPAESNWMGDGVAGLAPGCHFPLGRGPYGHCDLIGNLLEWVDAPTPVAKGGSWIDVEPRYASVSARATSEQPDLGSDLTGARCARSQ
jgi:formylglycine-generating enzyme required for sulfatase activity